MASIRVDLHFHPNLYGNSNTEGVCTAILEKCLKWDIKALVVSEHVYKDPTGSFKALYATQQRLIKSGYPKLEELFLFPGVEYMCTEGCEMVLFHDVVDGNGNTILYNIRERDILFHKPFRYTVADVIDIAQKYGLAIFAPHPYLGGMGGIKALGRTRTGREKIAQLCHHRRIGMEIYNAGWDVLLRMGAKVPTIRQLVETPGQLLDDAKPAFFGGGSDSHGPDGLGSGLTVQFSGKLTREGLYVAITRPRGGVGIFRARRGFGGFLQTLQGALKALKISSKEVIMENELLKQLEKDRTEILEKYVEAHERGDVRYEDIMKLKEFFRGKDMMTLLSEEQKKRVLEALRKRKEMRLAGKGR